MLGQPTAAPLPPLAPHGTNLGLGVRLPDPSAPTQPATNARLAYNPPDDNEVIIAVIGPTGSGKTKFINDVSNSSLRIGNGREPCTNVVQATEPFQLDGRNVVLLDTPGFDDIATVTDTDILRMIATYLVTTYQSGQYLAGIIYIRHVSDFRGCGIAPRVFRMFRKLCGESTLRKVVIVTNVWGQVSEELREAREGTLAANDLFFQPALDKGARMMRHDSGNGTASAQIILRYFLDIRPLAIQSQEEPVGLGESIPETATFEELARELVAQLEGHQEEMREFQRKML